MVFASHRCSSFTLGVWRPRLHVRRKGRFGICCCCCTHVAGRHPTYVLRRGSWWSVCLDFLIIQLPVASEGDNSNHGPAPAAGFISGVATSTLALAITCSSFCSVGYPVGISCCRRRAIPPSPQKPDASTLGGPTPTNALCLQLHIPLIRASGGLVVRDPASYNSIIPLLRSDFCRANHGVRPAFCAARVPLRERPQTKDQRFSAEETRSIRVHKFLSSYILLNLALMHRHVMFYNRYCVPSQVAILVALAVFLAYRVRPRIASPLMLPRPCLIIAILKIQIWHPLRLSPDSTRTGVLASLFSRDLPIVVGEGRVFMESESARKHRAFIQALFSKGSASFIAVRAYELFSRFWSAGCFEKSRFSLHG